MALKTAGTVCGGKRDIGCNRDGTWCGFIFCSLQTKSKEKIRAELFAKHHFRRRGAVPASAASLWHKAAWAGVSVLWDTDHRVSAYTGVVGTPVHLSTPGALSTTFPKKGQSCRAQTCPELAPEVVRLERGW